MRVFLRDLELTKNEEVRYAQATIYIAVMGYTLLLWDHIITFEDEVRYVWVRSKSPAAYLFFLNRYFTPVAFIGNLLAYTSNWSDNVQVGKLAVFLNFNRLEARRCDHFVRFEGSCTVIALGVAGLMLLLRVWALYKGRTLIVGSAIFLLLLEVGILAWLMTRSQRVHHQYVQACTMIFDPSLGWWPSLSAWMPLIYETYVTVLTLYSCLPRVRKSSASYIFRVLMRDGLVYYGVLFLVNFALAIMIIKASAPIKNITAQLEQLFTVAMISRITLSLRRSAHLHSQGLVTTIDNELDASERSPRLPNGRTQRSYTACQHISVVSGGEFPSDSESVYSQRTDSSRISKGRGQHVDIDFRRHDSGSDSLDAGTNSVGVLSISPAHSREAEAALGVGDSTWPLDRAQVVADPSMLNASGAYELRVMRPAHALRR